MNPIDKPLMPLPNELGFEQWYCENAFDYCKEPIGSRDCSLQRQAWHAALAADRASRPDPAGAVREVASREPVAWLDPSTLDVIHADRKKSWQEDYGLGGKGRAVTYTMPLHFIGAESCAAQGAVEREPVGTLRVSGWPTGLEYAFEPDDDLFTRLTAGSYRLSAIAVPGSRRELSGDVLDARRYRWLRDVGDATWRPFGLREGCTAALADAAIDAAITAARQEPKP